MTMTKLAVPMKKTLKMTLTTLKTEKEKNITSDGRNTGRSNHRPITRSLSFTKHERMHRHEYADRESNLGDDDPNAR